MKINIITDEVSADPENAIELAAQCGIHNFELRGFFTDHAPRFLAYQKQGSGDARDEFQAHVVPIGPGLFKFAYPASRAPRPPLGWMDRASFDNWAEAKRLADYQWLREAFEREEAQRNI